MLATTQLDRRLQPRLTPSDIVQETLLKAHLHFAQFHGQTERELLAWLRQILITSVGHLIDKNVVAARRDIRREVAIEELGSVEAASNLRTLLGAHCHSPSAEVRQREAATLLTRRLDQLPARYREVLILRNIDGLPFEEVALRVNRSPGATRMLWLRAIERLRAVYRKAGEHEA
jgi:RNA polymerase sigma-70 factor (ECF subfamily)